MLPLPSTFVSHTHTPYRLPKAASANESEKRFNVDKLLEAGCFLLDVVGRRNLPLLINVTGNEAFFQLVADCPRASVNKLLVVIGPDTELLQIINKMRFHSFINILVILGELLHIA